MQIFLPNYFPTGDEFPSRAPLQRGGSGNQKTELSFAITRGFYEPPPYVMHTPEMLSKGFYTKYLKLILGIRGHYFSKINYFLI